MNTKQTLNILAQAINEAALKRAKKDKKAFADLKKVAPQYPIYEAKHIHSPELRHWEDVVLPKAVQAVIKEMMTNDVPVPEVS